MLTNSCLTGRRLILVRLLWAAVAGVQLWRIFFEDAYMQRGFPLMGLFMITGIDRRFFRKKYNAQQVLAQFALAARDETDLDALTAKLVHVVQETLQPEFVSVLLKDTPTRKS